MIQGILPFRRPGIGDLGTFFKTHTRMNMTGTGNGLFQRRLEIFQETLGDAYPVGKIGSDHQVLPGFEIILHDTRMEAHPAPMRLMRHYQSILITELSRNVYQLKVLLESKIIPARMAINKDWLSLCTELQVMTEGILESIEVGAMRLVLMGYQQ